MMPKSTLMILCALACFPTFGDAPFLVPDKVDKLLAQYCYDCHDADVQKGSFQLDNMTDLTEPKRLALLNAVQEQLFTGEMPPEKKQQPTADERTTMLRWVNDTLHRHNASTLEAKLRYPSYGNYVDHERLFSGEIQDKAFTPARQWLVRPRIFEGRMRHVFELKDRRQRDMYKTFRQIALSNPLLLPDGGGIRDYDTGVVSEGHFLAMLPNAQRIVDRQLLSAIAERAGKKPTTASKRDKFLPATPAPLAAVVLASNGATEEEVGVAINYQFQRVLRRDATAEEIARYQALYQSGVEAGDVIESFRQVLIAILLEPEFFYRQEFGAGAEDLFGRRLLAPAEAAQAIAYALGNQYPDETLLDAAANGRLTTQADYRHEVTRLLDDTNGLRGKVDPNLERRKSRSSVSSHPRLVGFFRDFFGYTRALGLFKDANRVPGNFQNAGEQGAGTSGILIAEADQLVDAYLQQDEQVFERLLAGDGFMVAPVPKAAARIAGLQAIYERYKDVDYRNKKKNDFTKEEISFISKALGQRNGHGALKDVMAHVKRFQKTGMPPHPHFRYREGNLVYWSRFYGVDPYRDPYPTTQPAPVPNRRGMLTHPAWLMAQSANTHTDPVKRGRWIREKLLAGRVPDIPIGVDAVVHDDPTKTFRERLADATEQESCWRCHKLMNPLGYAFEAFDDFGQYRLEEPLEYEENIVAPPTSKGNPPTYKTKRVNTVGFLEGTGDPALDGEVTDAIDLVKRLAKSDRVRQSMVRHAFRFFLGRNEMLSDSQTLIEADRAYVESNGSFRALVVSLLSSDSFRYRKQFDPTQLAQQ